MMHAPPPNAQPSQAPFKDVADLGTAIARARRGLDAKAKGEAAGRVIALGIFLAETNGNQNVQNARSDDQQRQNPGGRG